jgi:hypothetical protein
LPAFRRRNAQPVKLTASIGRPGCDLRDAAVIVKQMVLFCVMARSCWPLVLLSACGIGGDSLGNADSGNDQGSGSNGNACATADHDEDGWSDEVEMAMGTSPMDAADHPGLLEELVFVVPYEAAARPGSHDLETTAKLARADVAILLDTTGSMLGTYSRIQGELAKIVQGVAAEIDDVAFGAAGYGDFPVLDGANSQNDVPFYRVHRMMTARTPQGLSSITASFTHRNIITSGLGNWFAGMRGGDEPEQHWEALRQIATGVGIEYPDPYGSGTRSVPAFSLASAFPATIPAGEEAGMIGGLGFRAGSTPIIIQITDTNGHVGGLTTTSPISATRPVAVSALHAIGARVVGIMAFVTVGKDDLTQLAIDTGGLVPPTAWGTGAARPANCPVGKCCLVAEDANAPPQPDPINGLCPLVFKSDFYSRNVSAMVVQGVVGIARGATFRIGAALLDDASDDVDAAAAFVDKIEALPTAACAGATVADTDEDGVPDAFPALVGGSPACFRITARTNTSVEAAKTGATRYRAKLQLTGDGVASFGTRDVSFVVPTCTPPILL